MSLCIGALLGVSLYLAPLLARDHLEERLRAAAHARGLELHIGAIYLDPLARLVLDDVRVHDRERRDASGLLRLRRLEVRFDVDGPRRPKVYLRDVRLDGLHLHLQRSRDGRTNLDGVLRWLATRGQREGGAAGAGGLRRYLSSHVPDLRVRGMFVAIDDEQGAPIRTPAGIDLRHLRAHDATLEVVDHSPVREKMHLLVKGRTFIKGLPRPLDLRGELSWPDLRGEAELQLPPELTADLAGFRVGLSSINVHSDGRVSLLGVKASRLGPADRGVLALAIRALKIRLAEEPVPASVIPEALRRRLPSAALTVLRHIAEVSIHEPVIAGVRPDAEAQQGDPQGAPRAGLAGRPGRRKLRQLLPRATFRTRDAADKPEKKHKRRRKKVEKKKRREPVKRDGSKVRQALARLFTTSTDRLEAGLADLRRFLAAQPVRLLSIHHGKARYRDDRAAAAPGEVSDFNARVERMADTGMIEVAVDFDVPGRPADNKITGRVDPRTGDTQLTVRLSQLPLAPYAALAPASMTIHGDSLIRDTHVKLGFNARDRQISLEGDVTVARVDVSLPPLSRHLIDDLSLSIGGRLLLDLKRQRLALDGGRLELGKVRVLAQGSVERYRTAPAFDLQIKVPTVRCQDAVEALVGPLAPMLAGMRCTGKMSFRFDLGLDTADMKTLKFDFSPVLRDVKIKSLGRYIHFNVLSFPFEHHARQADDSLYTFVTGPGSERWAMLPQISEYMTKVVNTTEDGAFWTHNGFSLGQIRSAMIANLQQGRFVRGASTISQQVVKNLFFVEREKTLSRKLQEAVITWELERTLEKEQILELYFNIIEFGPRVYGIRAAANHYFNRDPQDLSLLQCLWLGSIIPGPRRYYKHFTEGKVSDVWRRYLCRLGDIMVKRERILPKERARLGNCDVKFGGGNDGSEQPPEERKPWGLGHEGAFVPGMNPDDVIVPDTDPTKPGDRKPKAGVDEEDLP